MHATIDKNAFVKITLLFNTVRLQYTVIVYTKTRYYNHNGYPIKYFKHKIHRIITKLLFYIIHHLASVMSAFVRQPPFN